MELMGQETESLKDKYVQDAFVINTLCATFYVLIPNFQSHQSKVS